jgi:hypothetical protein
MPRIPKDLQVWIDARNRFHLSHAHVQMARELGMNPKKIGKIANHKQEPWKLSLPQFIEHLYQKRFGKSRPDRVVCIEERARQIDAKKAVSREARRKAETEVCGIAWYSPEQWDRLREISVDRDTLSDNYATWLAKAENEWLQKKDAGANAQKVPVDVNELEAWCRSRSWVTNEKSRARFVARIMRSSESAGDERIESEIPSQDEGKIPF